MPRLVLKDPVITIGTLDVSDDVSQVMLDLQYTAVTESITAGNAWAENSPSQKGRWSATITFEVSETTEVASTDTNTLSRLDPLLPTPLGSLDGQTQDIKIKVNTGDRSPANPEYSGKAILTGFQPLGGGQIGGVVRFTTTWQGDGQLTKNITA